MANFLLLNNKGSFVADKTNSSTMLIKTCFSFLHCCHTIYTYYFWKNCITPSIPTENDSSLALRLD